MWYYYNLAPNTMEINLPEGHIIPPEGCIILPFGRLDLRSTASLRQDHASRGWNNVAWGQYNFPWPEGTVVMTFLCRQYCFSLSLDLQSTASLRQDNAPLRRNNAAFWQYNFLWPGGMVVMMTFLYRQYCFSLSRGWQIRDNDSTVFHCPRVVKQPKLYCLPVY